MAESDPIPEGLQPPPTTGSGMVAYEVLPRKFSNYIVSERELHSVGFMSATGSLFTALFGVAFGAALSLGITLKTVAIPTGNVYIAFWVGFLVSLIATIVFLGLSIIMFIRAFVDVRTIKRESEQRRRELYGAS